MQPALCRASRPSARFRFGIDGWKSQIVELPSTGGAWAAATAATVDSDRQYWRKAVLHVVPDQADLNGFTIESRE